ncbi:hypothetical protein ABVT39_015337 [Epinephelus coioides]
MVAGTFLAPLLINLPSADIASVTTNTPHLNNEHPVATSVPKTTKTLKSVITPAIPSEVTATVPAVTVSAAATNYPGPSDSMSVEPTSPHKTTTIPRKAITIHPATTTQQSSAIAKLPTSKMPQTTSIYAPSAVAVTSTPSVSAVTATTQTAIISKESTSTKPSSATAAVSSMLQTATTTLSNTSVTSDSTDPQLTLASSTTDLAKMSTEPLISPTSQSSLSVSSSSKVTTFPFTDSLNRTSTAAFQTTNASHPAFSVSQSPSATSVARLIISTHSQPSPSAPSQTSVPPAMFKPPLPLSNSSTLCPPLTQFAISQYYQNVLAYYQVLHQYHSNN